MAPGGVLLAPIGEAEQCLKRVRKDDDGRFTVEDLGPVRFTDLIGGVEE
jgi:protein-L-isoaspartate O-methyltransferase